MNCCAIGPARVRKEVPTLRDFAPRFLEGYARANRQKPSGIAGKETILRVHLVPALGARHLDAITTEDVQRLKRALENRSPKTVNNVLTVLNTLLKQAVAWDVIETVPCTIRLLKAPQAAVRFHDFEAFERLVVAADRLDRTTLLLVLLGGEAGLRCGEMMALEWRDVELGQRRLCVARSDWKGQVTATKGERVRYVPLDAAARASAPGAPTTAWQAGAHPAWWDPADPEGGAAGGCPGGSESECLAGCTHPASYLLLASDDARRPREGHSGTGWAQEPVDDAAVHALESRGD